MQVTAARWNLMKVGVAVTAVALAFVASPAFGWEIVKSTNGVIVNVESTDTTVGAGLRLYYAYKGGDYYASSWPANATGSYASFKDYGTNELPLSGLDAFELAFMPGGGRVQMLRLGAGPNYRFVVMLAEPLQVSFASTPTVNIGSMPAVEGGAGGSVSIEGTPTVVVEGFDPDFRSSMFGATVLAVLGLFVVIGHRLTRGR